jgi:TonB family protein
MKRRFYRYVILVTGIHVFAIMVLVVFSAIPNPFKEEDEVFMSVDMVFDTVQPAPEVPTEVKEVPDPQDSPSEKLAKPKKKARPDVEVSQSKIQRPDANQTANNNPNQEEIRNSLAGAIKNQLKTTSSDADQRYLNLIKSVLYEAWAEPSVEVVGASKALVKIKLDSRGRIIERVIVTGSGNTTMDASVMAALKRVQRIDGLSADFISRHAVVTIGFRVES